MTRMPSCGLTLPSDWLNAVERRIAGNATDIFRIVGLRGITGDVDDHARTARFHQRIEGAAHIDVSEDLQIPRLAPGLLVNVEKCSARDGAGIVHENIDMRKLALRGRSTLRLSERSAATVSIRTLAACAQSIAVRGGRDQRRSATPG